MKWNRTEIVGAAAFAALSVALLLVPHIPLAGGTPHERLGEDLAADLDEVNLGIGPRELAFDLESSPVPSSIFDLRDSSAYSKWHLDGATNATVHELVSGVGTVCPPGTRVVLYDSGEDSGLAAQAAVLMRLNGCDAVWLKEGVLAAMDYMGVARPGRKDAPKAAPPVRTKPPVKKPAVKKVPRPGGGEGC